MELTEFLRARLDEDEAAAKEAGSRPLGPAWDDGTRHTAVARHIARHDPARVLREVEAKRRIVDDYRITANACRRMTGPELDTPHYRAVCAGRDAFRSACASLAKAWSDHADYQEWA